MKVGDLVRRTVAIPGLDKILGVVLKISSHRRWECEVLWPDGNITIPIVANLEVIN